MRIVNWRDSDVNGRPRKEMKDDGNKRFIHAIIYTIDEMIQKEKIEHQGSIHVRQRSGKEDNCGAALFSKSIITLIDHAYQ